MILSDHAISGSLCKSIDDAVISLVADGVVLAVDEGVVFGVIAPEEAEIAIVDFEWEVCQPDA